MLYDTLSQYYRMKVHELRDKFRTMIKVPLPDNLNLMFFPGDVSNRELDVLEKEALILDVEIMFLQRMYDFWVAEEDRFWKKEKDYLIPVRIELALDRIKPYIFDYLSKKHQRETGTPYPYPWKPRQEVKRIWIDYRGVTNWQKPITKHIQTFEYFPYYLPSNTENIGGRRNKMVHRRLESKEYRVSGDVSGLRIDIHGSQ